MLGVATQVAYCKCSEESNATYIGNSSDVFKFVRRPIVHRIRGPRNKHLISQTECLQRIGTTALRFSNPTCTGNSDRAIGHLFSSDRACAVPMLGVAAQVAYCK